MQLHWEAQHRPVSTPASAIRSTDVTRRDSDSDGENTRRLAIVDSGGEKTGGDDDVVVGSRREMTQGEGGGGIT